MMMEMAEARIDGRWQSPGRSATKSQQDQGRVVDREQQEVDEFVFSVKVHDSPHLVVHLLTKGTRLLLLVDLVLKDYCRDVHIEVESLQGEKNKEKFHQSGKTKIVFQNQKSGKALQFFFFLSRIKT